jgi:hypothetical protein
MSARILNTTGCGRMVLGLALAISCASDARALMLDVFPPSTADFDPSVPCPTPQFTPGGTDLINKGLVQVQNLGAAAKAALAGVLNAQFGAPWTYTWGDNLGGSLFVKEYEAVDVHDGDYCLHGADFSVTYSQSWDVLSSILEGDWKRLQWIQLIDRSHQAIADAGGQQWGVDPPADKWIDYNDNGKVDSGEIQDKAPFYYNSWETSANLVWDRGGTNLRVELDFADYPRSPHDELIPWHGDKTFYLFLATWDGNFNPGASPHNVVIRDCVTWGWDGICVPLPSAGPAGLTILLLLPLNRLARRLLART